MTRPWRLLTARGRLFFIVGVAVVLIAMASGQRDVMRIGLLLAALPVVAADPGVPSAPADVLRALHRAGPGATRIADDRPDRARPGGPAAGGDLAAGGFGAAGARQPAAVSGRQGRPALASGGGVPAAGPGSGTVLHRSADRTHQRSVRSGPVGPAVRRHHRSHGHPSRGAPGHDPQLRRGGQYRRGPAAPGRRGRPGRRAGPGVPAG